VSLIYTRYGLIYNPDGTLCISLKPQTIFENITPFVVERSTINLVKSSNFYTDGTTTTTFPELPPVNPIFGSYVP